jgi:hypothetical protein
VVEATEQLILKHNPKWALAGGMRIRVFARDAATAGFGDIECFSFDVLQPYSHEAGAFPRIRCACIIGRSRWSAAFRWTRGAIRIKGIELFLSGLPGRRRAK